MLTGRAQTNHRRWYELGVQYAEEYGWRIIPIERTTANQKHSDDPVERQLKNRIWLDSVEDATSSPDEIEELGVKIPRARVGAATGQESNLIAVEVPEKAGDTSVVKEIQDIAGDTPRVEGAAREYYLFQYPNVHSPLPALTQSGGVTLHGQDSVIFLPKRHYTWGTGYGKQPHEAGHKLLSLFGLDDHLPKSEDGRKTSESTEGSGTSRGNEEEQEDEPVQLDLPLERTTSDGQPPEQRSRDLFRSGSDLQLNAEDDHLDLPWAVAGGLTVLTGRPKTSGKSTWLINLAAHLAAGKPYLGEQPGESSVVLLTDTSPSNFRKLLRRIGVTDEEDLARLHVVHPSDVRRRNWHSTLDVCVDHAARIDADLIAIDCLERYVQLKNGGEPTTTEHVVHSLTTEIPPTCSLVAVKSTKCDFRESVSRTIERLHLLGRSADVILRLDNIATDRHPSLRRLISVSRGVKGPRSIFCALRHGRYTRVDTRDKTNLPSQFRGTSASSLAANSRRLTSSQSSVEQLPS